MTSKNIVEPPHWVNHGTRKVPLPYVEVADRIIPPTKARIDTMAERLRDRGQLVPILVKKLIGDRWGVVAGATRVAAGKQLGWDEIEATHVSADNDYEYALIEIEENRDRYDLTADERELLKAKDKELRAQRLAHFDELMKNPHPAHQEPKPERKHATTGKPKGRPKGGVRDAARKAGVPKSTAHDRATAISPARAKKPPATAVASDASTLAVGNSIDAEASVAARKAAYDVPEVFSPESWAAKTPNERKLIVAGWGPSIIGEMKFRNMPADLLAEMERHVGLKIIERVRKMTAPDDRAVLSVIEHVTKAMRLTKAPPAPKVEQAPAIEKFDPFKALGLSSTPGAYEQKIIDEAAAKKGDAGDELDIPESLKRQPNERMH